MDRNGCTSKAKPPFPSLLIQLIQGCAPAQGCRFESPYLLTPQTLDRNLDVKETALRNGAFRGPYLPCPHVFDGLGGAPAPAWPFRGGRVAKKAPSHLRTVLEALSGTHLLMIDQCRIGRPSQPG